MSRNWIPALVAIGVGVFSGYYSFQPALKELQIEKTTTQRVQPGQQTQAPNTSQIPPSSTKDGLDVPLKPDAGSAQGGISK
ncbi:hypothetical protein BDV29DRAFT_182057 [Aspergillus leporis]|uniref:Uncharacterized protein n=1 Tax=Aspergillus leporis TaxID=41062 RepID=A0A5N5WRI4_9EURO|nr:hypothetical protein BDV29DRAFT_182057 [Aspergillus leporis]